MFPSPESAGVGVLLENCCSARVGVALPLCDEDGVVAMLSRLTGAGVSSIPNPWAGVASVTKSEFGVPDTRLQIGVAEVCFGLKETDLPRTVEGK